MPKIVSRTGLAIMEKSKGSRWSTIRKDIITNKYVYIMLLPVMLYFLIFHYGPMYGVQIAFKQFSPGKGILGSPWVGLRHFMDFFRSYYFLRLIRNTLVINIYDILFGFPAPIILAMLLNEIRNNTFKRTVQTVTYLPHFISLVVICGIIIDFTSRDGVINALINAVGAGSIPFMSKPSWFRFIYVVSDIWQYIGWGSIIYLAALTGIDQELYEAARIDGAGRWKQTLSITLPGLAPTIIIMLILRIGKMMNVGAEKVLLLYNPTTYETADVISTFIYRKGLIEMSYSYSAAVGLFNSLINFALMVVVNRISRRISETSLW